MVTLLECKQSWKNEKNCQKIEWNWKLNRSWNHDHDSNCKKKRPRYTVCVFVLFSLFIHRAGIEEESLNQSWKWSRVNQFPYSIGKREFKTFYEIKYHFNCQKKISNKPFFTRSIFKDYKIGPGVGQINFDCQMKDEELKSFFKKSFLKGWKSGPCFNSLKLTLLAASRLHVSTLFIWNVIVKDS